MFLNDDIENIEKTDGTCLLTFVVDESGGLFLPLLNIQDQHK